MTVTVVTGLPVETDSVLAATTRGLSGQVYAATATDTSDSPFVYEDFVAAGDVFLQFDLRIDRYTLDSWNEGGREAQLFELRNMDTLETVVDLWVKRHNGRFVWFASTDLGSGDSAYGSHMVAAGTHTVYVAYEAAGAGLVTVTLPLDVLQVSG
jgi:hypothetical protein